MKNALRVTAVLLCLCIAAAVFISHDIMSGKDKVTVARETLYGDESAAEGIRLDLESSYKRHLFWNTRYAAGENTQTDTRYTFHAIEKDIRYRRDTDPLMMYDDFDYDFKKDTHWGLEDVCRDLVSKLQPGQEAEKQVLLWKHCEYYPFAVSINIPSNYMGWTSNVVYSGDESLINQYGFIAATFSEYFKIPVYGSETYTVTARMSKMGNSTTISGSRSGEEVFNIETQSVKNDDAFYFVFDAHTSNKYLDDPHIVDTSRIKGGFGIYKLPYTMGERKQNDIDIQVDRLETVFPLDPDDYIRELDISADGRYLYLFSVRDKTLYITVIDTETYIAVQDLPIGPMDSSYAHIYYTLQDDYMVVFVANKHMYTFSRDKQGLLTFDYGIEINKHGEEIEWYYSGDISIGYDGERLVVCNPHYESGVHVHMNVYTKDGLQYRGRYTLSLNQKGDGDENIFFTENSTKITFE